MAKTNVAEKVTEKKVAQKIDYKALAESIENAFKSDKTVDVVADTKKDYPKSMTENDYRYIHFYNPGTEKNMFGLYIKSNAAKFAVANNVGEYLDKGLTVSPVEKKIKGEKKIAYLVVSCPHTDIVDTAKKIISAYQSKPAKAEKTKAEKPEKKAEPKKVVEKKPTTTVKKTTKKVANK